VSSGSRERDYDDDDKDGATKPKTEAAEKVPAEPKRESEDDYLKKIVKRKVNGKEVEMTVEEALRKADLYGGAEDKFQEAAKLRKEVESFVDSLKSNPLGTLKQLGIDVRDHAEQYLTEEVQREMMSPEERELQELRQFKQQQEDGRAQEEMTAKERQQQAQENQARSQAQQFYDHKITEVLSQSNLPKTPYTVKRVAGLLKTALSKGYELPIETAVDMVRGEFTNDVSSMAGTADVNQLIKLLGPDIIKRLRKHDLDSIKAKRTPATPADIAETTLSPSKPRQPRETTTQGMNMDEWKAHIRKKAGL